MAIYFNIIIPVKAFLEIAEGVMPKYDVRLYIEKMSINGSRKRRFYVKDGITEKDFLDEEYNRFFFSTQDVDIRDKEIVIDSGEVIYSDWFSFYDSNSTIEGEGGRENGHNIECIKLRIVYKEPEKQIKAFYSALQTRLKKIEGIKQYKLTNLYKIYYVETERIMWSDFRKKVPATIK